MKAKKLSMKESLVLLVGLGFAWSKLGIGTAVRQVFPETATALRPDGTCPPGWFKLAGRCIKL